MVTILAISDSHGDLKRMQKILNEQKYDISVHLGDSELDEAQIKKMFDYYVGGNNDFNYSLEEIVVEVNQTKIALCHGHTVFARSSNFRSLLASFGQKNNASIVIYGHTHVSMWENYHNIDLINPGSITLPRSHNGKTYCLIEIDHKKVKNVIFKNVP